MDDHYAALSMVAGMLAGRADRFLGGTYFQTEMRKHAWNLTAEKLAQWRMEALRMGVPETELEFTENDLAQMAALLPRARKLQDEIDRRARREEN
jgi:hypothetical protein